MKFLENRYYPAFMYVSLIVVSLLILFNFASILNQAQKQKITGFHISETDIKNNSEKNQNNSIFSESPESPKNTSSTESPKDAEIYTFKSYLLYYSLLINLILLIFIAFNSLKRTIWKNIEEEEKEFNV